MDLRRPSRPFVVVASLSASVVVACAVGMGGCVSDETPVTCTSLECLHLDASAGDGQASTPDARTPAADARAADDATADDATTSGDAADAAPASDATSTADAGARDGAVASDAGEGTGPHALASGLSFPWRIAIAAGFAYTTTANGVVKIPLAGGTSATITQAPGIELVTADATNLYFSVTGGTIYKRAHAGATNVAISNAIVANSATGLIADATHVYWTENLVGGVVRRVAIDGSSMAGEAVSPSLQLPRGLVFAGGATYVAESAGTTGAGKIVRLAADGGTPTALASNRTGASNPVTDGSRIYWFDNGGTSTGPILSIPLAGGSVASHAITAVDPSMLTDGATFYYGNATGGIVRINFGASTVQTLYTSSQTGDVYGLGLAGNALYWTDFNGGRVMTAPK